MSHGTHSLHDPIEEDPDFVPDAEVIPFKLNPKGPEDEDWLSPLKEGTVFLRKDNGKPNAVVAMETHIYSKTPNGSFCLKTMLLNLDFYYEWIINPKLYCKSQALVEILRVPKEEEHGKGSV